MSVRYAERIAVIQDIHGNLPALEAVLADIATETVDTIVINGDIADGPFPVETLDVLKALGDRAMWLGGNADRWLVEAFDSVFQPRGDPSDEITQWAAARLGRAHRDWLASLPSTGCISVQNLGPVGLCHATPRSDNEMFLVDSSIAQFHESFATSTETMIVVGHSHMPFDRLFDRRRVVNAGSVGMPYGHTGAAWALIGPDVVLRRTDYDVDAAAARFNASHMPDASGFAADNIRTAPSDADALSVFGAIMRRQQIERAFD